MSMISKQQVGVLCMRAPHRDTGTGGASVEVADAVPTGEQVGEQEGSE